MSVTRFIDPKKPLTLFPVGEIPVLITELITEDS